MVAEKNHEVMDQAISSVWLLTEDEQIREQIRRRTANEHAYQRGMDRLSELEDENVSLKERNVTLEEKNASLEKRSVPLEEEKISLEKELATLRNELAGRND